MFFLIRLLDFLLAFFGLVFLSPVLFILVIVGLFDTGSPIFVQTRVGKKQGPFNLYKFRTMHISTESAATHTVSSCSVTKYGSFLRKTKLDELPQLVNVVKGDMSLVGYRPCLPTQVELISLRENHSLHLHKPGITGLAQIKKVDMSAPEVLSQLDHEMYQTFSLYNYFYYIIMTIRGSGAGDNTK
ncbi:sugar transferase [Vibrio atlanticus]|uniref:sugar transferase n=1 Tax=Vibrio atlanticus TaxID=693153 RepID=UPI003D143CE0